MQPTLYSPGSSGWYSRLQDEQRIQSRFIVIVYPFVQEPGAAPGNARVSVVRGQLVLPAIYRLIPLLLMRPETKNSKSFFFNSRLHNDRHALQHVHIVLPFWGHARGKRELSSTQEHWLNEFIVASSSSS
jgi:hypothetical protein